MKRNVQPARNSPWVANCVGFHNYRAFVFFVASVALSCAYLSVECVVALYYFPYREADWTPDARSAVVATFIIGTALALALGCLLAWHLYLSLTAQTTIE